MAVGGIILSGCDTIKPEPPTVFHYTKPELSGLTAVRPYPEADGVCQLIAPNASTIDLQSAGRALIACPKHEKDALGDRRKAGARVVGNAKHWVILSIKAPTAGAM